MNEETERRQQIVEAAFQEFAHKGFRGATIKSIAQAAALSAPSLIYWYFPTKEDLFQAVIESRVEFFQVISQGDELLDTPPDVFLLNMARSYLMMTRIPEMSQMIRLLIAEASQRPELADLISQRLMVPVLSFLQRYMTRQVQLGHLRPHDVRSSSRVFIGLLIPQALSQTFLPALRQDGLSNEEHSAAAIDLFLHGLKQGS
ncbi:MAG: TetR/AcrR family transcriptional regulator [Chloroflexi bacterium]|nr:TetR/AcrR family transcriptional regulator [Chloroflexota bacterium]MBP8059160.1 TetR/AcrR family transcriptional regulator [Chloroflexota bacterium]